MNLLKSWSPADSITSKQLTLKLFMLAALISAARKSSLDKFDLRFRFPAIMHQAGNWLKFIFSGH